MRIDRYKGITLYVARRRRWWRPWWWVIADLKTGLIVEGYAWTLRRAIQDGEIARALRSPA